MRKQAERTGAARTLQILQRLLAEYHARDFAVRLWDGTSWISGTSSPRFTIILRHPAVLRAFVQKTDLAISEAYVRGDVEVEGDLESAIALGEFLRSRSYKTSTLLQAAWDLLRIPSGGVGKQAIKLRGQLHSIKRDRRAVTYHYNVSNDFYRLWLDRRMVYSCAYFQAADQDLETAQARKLEYLCRKLRLRAGERLLDIGCGWGGLVRYAARHFGVEALGITLSENQAQLANELIAQDGLSAQCRVEVLDYRELKQPAGFDKLVSVGMFEHVGEQQLPKYFEQAAQLLRPGGVFLNHGIARRIADLESSAFVRRYVFPDGELAPISSTAKCAEEVGFEVRDVESLREHYALTLRRWTERLETQRERAIETAGETTYRIWKLYMTGSAHGFAIGALNVYQLLLVKPDRGRSGLPLTREDWYEEK
jgi:cyclopropane-fatty-acyl-phospholipid synthase